MSAFWVRDYSTCCSSSLSHTHTHTRRERHELKMRQKRERGRKRLWSWEKEEREREREREWAATGCKLPSFCLVWQHLLHQAACLLSLTHIHDPPAILPTTCCPTWYSHLSAITSRSCYRLSLIPPMWQFASSITRLQACIQMAPVITPFASFYCLSSRSLTNSFTLTPPARETNQIVVVLARCRDQWDGRIVSNRSNYFCNRRKKRCRHSHTDEEAVEEKW